MFLVLSVVASGQQTSPFVSPETRLGATEASPAAGQPTPPFAQPGPVQPALTSQRVYPVRALTAGAIPGHGETNLWDDDLSTKWAAPPNEGTRNVCVLDFGSPVELVGITVYHASAGGEGINLNTEDFHFEIGPGERGPWSLLFRVVDNEESSTVRSLSPVRTRYVRLVVEDSMSMSQPNVPNDDNIARIPEIHFFGRRLEVGGTEASVRDARAQSDNPFPDERSVASSRGPGLSAPFLNLTPAPSPTAEAPQLPPASRFGVTPGTAARFPLRDWERNPLIAGDLARKQGKRIVVFFRSEDVAWQSTADLVLADPFFLARLKTNNVLLLVDLNHDPKAGIPFGVVRAPTLSQWTDDGTELARLWKEEITRENILAKFGM